MPDFSQSVKTQEAYRAEMYGVPRPQACPACGGLGWVRSGAQHGEPQFGKLEPCDVCGNDRHLQYITANCGLQGAELDSRLATWQTNTGGILSKQRLAAKRAIEDAIRNRCGFVSFYGDFGGGKTLALQIVVNEMRHKQIEAFYAPLASVLDHLRSLFNSDKKSSGFWQRLLDIPVLALDEVTRFHDTGWAQERLWVLADTRYRRIGSHLTVFATNDDPTVSLPTSEPVGYLYSRMRQGCLVELRGDMRARRP
jgi:DNA replication protein DnaC